MRRLSPVNACRWLKAVAAITGEAAVGDRTNMVYASTSATYGRGRGVVVAITTLVSPRIFATMP
jgi:magnesium-transporting ATPase (P-type)